MINNPLTLDKALEILNSMVEADPDAAYALIETRVPCNQDLAEHPSIQVVAQEDGSYSVGLLGILNGLFGTIEEGPKKGWGAITAVFDVVCPVCGVHEGDCVVGDPCPKCDRFLKLGPLMKFQRTQGA